jgi:hypothetical protein
MGVSESCSTYCGRHCTKAAEPLLKDVYADCTCSQAQLSYSRLPANCC